VSETDQPPLWRRRWFVISAGIVLLLVVIAAVTEDPDKPRDRAATSGPTPTPTVTPTPDPATAARTKATELVADGHYLKAVALLEAAGLDQAAARVGRRGGQVLQLRARRALAAGRFATAKTIAIAARDLHRSPAATALIATATTKLAQARAAARLAKNRATCTRVEKVAVRTATGVPPGCDAFAAQVAEERAAEEAEAAEAAPPDCDPNYAGACLDPNSSDYDCEGGSGDGPDYTGTVRVVGDDPYDLDRDGDKVACDA
jgi:hypothetical protein